MALEEQIVIPLAGGAVVHGDLSIPDVAVGVVVFAHGSGSGRHSPRNRAVAGGLRERGLATLLMDLLTMEEEQVDLRTREHRFDIPLLAERLVQATAVLAERDDTRRLPIGLFGASTGAAAALVAASRQPERVRAVVSRGGRPDMAGDALPLVQAPTLLVVGGRDEAVIDLNQSAYEQLDVERRLAIVAGATHLFEEEGAIEEVVHLAGDWFVHHLAEVPDGR